MKNVHVFMFIFRKYAIANAWREKSVCVCCVAQRQQQKKAIQKVFYFPEFLYLSLCVLCILFCWWSDYQMVTVVQISIHVHVCDEIYILSRSYSALFSLKSQFSTRILCIFFCFWNWNTCIRRHNLPSTHILHCQLKVANHY